MQIVSPASGKHFNYVYTLISEYVYIYMTDKSYLAYCLLYLFAGNKRFSVPNSLSFVLQARYIILVYVIIAEA